MDETMSHSPLTDEDSLCAAEVQSVRMPSSPSDQDDWACGRTEGDRYESQSGTQTRADITSASPGSGQLSEHNGRCGAGGLSAEKFPPLTAIGAQPPTTRVNEKTDAETYPQDATDQILLEKDKRVRNLISELGRDVNTIIDRANSAGIAASRLWSAYNAFAGKLERDDPTVHWRSPPIVDNAAYMKQHENSARMQLAWLKEASECLGVPVNEKDCTIATGGADNEIHQPTASAASIGRLPHERNQITDMTQTVGVLGGLECKVVPTLLAELSYWSYKSLKDLKQAHTELENQYLRFLDLTDQDQRNEGLGPDLVESCLALGKVLTAYEKLKSDTKQALEAFVQRDDKVGITDLSLLWFARVKKAYDSGQRFDGSGGERTGVLGHCTDDATASC